MNETEDKEIVVVEHPVRKRRIPPAAYAVAGVAALGLLVLGWYLLGSRGGEAGKPVPAPRSSLDETQSEPLANQTITLSPEQIKNAGVTIETVGEQLSTESTETSATGTVGPNEYKQTPP